MAALHKLHLLLCQYPRSRALIVRKTRKSMTGTALVTYEKKLFQHPPNSAESPIKTYGGERVEWYEYPNGSRLVTGGMDNPQKTLSSEYDFVYVNQAEELTADEWQALTRAASGRAGNAPYSQVFGDVNPGPPGHWILHRERINLIESRHEDNPTIFERDADGRLTGNYAPGGEARIATLDAMTGTRYKRGRLGLWVAAEGQVYEYDPAIHEIDPRPIPDDWPRYRVIDFGYVNPFVCLWFATDEDGRLYMYRQIYMTERTVAEHLPGIHKRSQGESYVANITDHDAENRGTLERGVKDENGRIIISGIGHTIAARKSVEAGIEKVEERLKVQGDGKPRIFFMRDSLVEMDQSLREKRKPYHAVQEFAGYVRPTPKDGKSADERPIKVDDHAMDCVRYMVMYLDGGLSQQVKVTENPFYD